MMTFPRVFKNAPFFLHLLLFVTYLSLNIEAVGEHGVALPLLALFFVFSVAFIFKDLLSYGLSIRLHFFIFLLLVAWIALRVIIDLGDVEYLKQITVATTGGMLVFFLAGSFSRKTIENITLKKDGLFYSKLLILVFLLISVVLFVVFRGSLLDRSDIFYIEGVRGGYQRPGNFLIIFFIIFSYSYLSICAHNKVKFIRVLAWTSCYSVGFFLLLISSQMIGSNAATANLLAIYMMSIVIALMATGSKVRNLFFKRQLSLPLSKTILKKLIFYSGVALIFIAFSSFFLLHVTNFDLSKTRVFGFGSGSNSSLSSRLDILLETGGEQLGYAPFFGNLDVARITTGYDGRTLHTFIPNVMAELGLVGLVLVMTIFIMTLRALLRNIKRSPPTPDGLKFCLVNFWLFFTLLWFFIYANMAVGKSWPVMWFFIGFSVSVFISSKN